MSRADIGLIGLAVMGENLALNMASHGFTVAVYNRTVEKVDRFVAGRGKDAGILGCHSLQDLCASLKTPRKVFLMVKAGQPVDDLIGQLLELLEPGDVIIDGGNSHFPDTMRRAALAESQGLLYVGCGVSGGEEGALNGPSMMPGGSPEAWALVKPIFQSICAKAEDGSPCCEWVGENGAGHFVKMVHNGIEYGDMQLICEAYQLMRDGLGMNCEEMRDTFARWNETELNSYLIGITADILGYRDEKGEITVEHILDTAGQKGTGKWTAIAALEEGVPLTLISEAVFARCLSARKEERLRASEIFPRQLPAFEGDRAAFVECIRKALYASKIVSYAQGFQLMGSAAQTYGWNLNYGGIALMWRGGCIIRSAFLGKIKEAFDKNPELDDLLTDEYFSAIIRQLLPAWRKVAAWALTAGIPAPAFTAALSWFDGYTTARLPANLLQAQRDYFGAHTYERIDAPRGKHFHTDWTGHGGGTAAGTYNA
jgi:6-phosphogluconate dehydrogenase